jgi:hypothetical protein
MKLFWSCAAFLVLALPCVAQTGPQKTVKPAVAPGRVTGTVLCFDTRKPCRGVRILLAENRNSEDAENFSSVTDINGAYVFENVPPGKYLAIANLTGYLSSRIPPEPEAPFDSAARGVQMAAWQQSLLVDVASSQTSMHDITILRGSSLSGRVLYADGSPAIHAWVRVEHADPDAKTGEPDKDHHLVPSSFENASTNDLGQFRISGIRPGSYRVTASPISQDTGVLGGEKPTTFAIYSGDTIHRKAAKVYKLRLGDDVGNIEITIPIGGVHRVAGRLATADNYALNMGVCTLSSVDDDSVVYRTGIDSTGNFAFANVPTGAYTLSVTNAYIGKPAEASRDSLEGSTDLEPSRAFAVDALCIFVEDSDLTDLAPTLKEIPLPAKTSDPDEK